MNKAIAFSTPTAKTYIVGYLLAMLLTAIPFALVASGKLPVPLTLAILFVMAVSQVLVHLRYFLHLNFSRGKEWLLISLVFTCIIMGIVAAGTVWILYNLDANMMPR